MNSKKCNSAFAEKCAGKDVRTQILLAGRAHPAAMAAASELVIERALGAPNADDTEEIRALRKALTEKLPQDVKARLSTGVSSPDNQNMLASLKKDFFVEIRNAVMNVPPKNSDGTNNSLYEASSVFKHFSDRGIVKLDYNEGSKFSQGDCAHAGTFMRPERIIVGRKMGQLYRFQTRTTADSASAGAVTEALVLPARANAVAICRDKEECLVFAQRLHFKAWFCIFWRNNASVLEHACLHVLVASREFC